MHTWTMSSPSVGQACTYNGKKYALPLTQHYVAFFYNKHIFKKHNITPPTTWAGFRKACKTLKKAGVTPIALGSRERWPAQFWFDYLLLRIAGPEYRQRLMEGKASYSDPEVAEVFCQWRQLLEAGYFNPAPSLLDWAEATALVQSGKAAMTLMGTWIIGLLDGKMGWKQDKDYAFFRFPAMGKEIPMTALGTIDVIVTSKEGHPDKVNQILAYFSDPGPQMEMSRGSGALSPSKAIPTSFYTPMQARILKVIRETPYWAFNYDLATPRQWPKSAWRDSSSSWISPVIFGKSCHGCLCRPSASFGDTRQEPTGNEDYREEPHFQDRCRRAPR